MELWNVIEAVVRPLGYEVLEVTLKGGGKTRVLTVRLERADEQPISFADLERASQVISLELDRLDPIPGAYRLEVESPGPDRPLITARHFERFMGLKAKVQSDEGRFTGRIVRVEGDVVTFALATGEERALKLGTFKANLAEWPSEPR
ncbi:ribosome maturation factor RimP [Marinithermus hydrothermalis]|uniref:Ribosome maturation factor RimP n=1 Tax=Marinithermus hydrothermalis (strain DSM 14884 / JCM 11576 / T1) TaxID=869210 RepID=F2NP17_MARHT|nr:ribosome maturation factor RimP [Marinithermus hydrothermalis]AEB11605.1 Ribosome maturation factor rimP [Marinithermus hydrothermalis DSM 14884]